MHIMFDFEKPIKELEDELEKIHSIARKTKIDVSATIKDIEEKITSTRSQVYNNLTAWNKVQISRHPKRPYTLDYINYMCSEFIELHGDRNFRDDKAIVGGFGYIDNTPIMIIGHQKGINTKDRQYRNFGMANPEGYRKALRLMKLAEKFNIAVVTLVDTPGAYPGIEAEERGQGEAIARNLFEMAQLEVPIISFIIGEGASGGALGISVSDKSYMLSYTWYSVISPESCSSILWRNWDHKISAAESLKLSAEDMYQNKLIDGIIEEPFAGAHNDPEAIAMVVKRQILSDIAALSKYSKKNLVESRINKFSNMGVVKEINK
ncbi:MAG: acetyl-CoA carboxylase carboxyltransferase subunit alpha [Solitalea-like symbiont of Tyrophagus putrescentiae]